MRVSEVVTDEVRTVDPGTRVADMTRSMRDGDIGSLPVAEDDRLIGMVTDRDIVLRGLADGAIAETLCARDVMSPRLLYCRADQSIEAVLENMGEQQVRRLPVVDGHKRLVGGFSLGDLSRAAEMKAGGALKEISEPVTR
jgi:CBS domain-containing protein